MAAFGWPFGPWSEEANRQVAADDSGNWTADFSVPEGSAHNIRPGSGGFAEERDADEDTTWVIWTNVAYAPHGYPDVPGGAFYEDGLDWAKAEGIVVADFADGGFHPGDPVNRGQITNILWTMMDQPPGSPPHGFRPPDVPANAWYDDALDWAKAEGLVTGYTRTVDCRPRPVPCYKPKDPVLRGQVVNMAWNMVGAPTGLPAFSYTDIPATAPYRTAMN